MSSYAPAQSHASALPAPKMRASLATASVNPAFSLSRCSGASCIPTAHSLAAADLALLYTAGPIMVKVPSEKARLGNSIYVYAFHKEKAARLVLLISDHQDMAW